jgi:hypothetical protein
MKKWSFFLICIAMLQACEKDITIEPAQTEPTLVVEGQIENGQHLPSS